MQASEIESASFEEGAEWIEKSDAAGHEEVAPTANGHTAEEAAPTEGVSIIGNYTRTWLIFNIRSMETDPLIGPPMTREVCPQLLVSMPNSVPPAPRLLLSQLPLLNLPPELLRILLLSMAPLPLLLKTPPLLKTMASPRLRGVAVAAVVITVAVTVDMVLVVASAAVKAEDAVASAVERAVVASVVVKDVVASAAVKDVADSVVARAVVDSVVATVAVRRPYTKSLKCELIVVSRSRW